MGERTAPGRAGRYDPTVDEARWIEAWEASGALSADPDAPGEPYAVAVPPPNVTGSLHLGHALNLATQDVLIRHHRMAGRPTFWICGTDHAGIATQAVVEKRLAADGIRRQDLGREEFVRSVWAWRERLGGTIIAQAKRLGCTLDYGRERFTMDEAYARAVLAVFVGLHRKGYIYRDRYMVNWDPGLGSAISDLEVEDREVTDSLVEIAYPLADGGGEVVVATVRPETMLGDTAVAVSPGDERYRHLVGREVTLPLVGRRLPIVADEHVDPEFGTGCLKITPAHDPNDFEIGRRHGLDQVSVIGEDGRMTAEAGVYAGLPAADAQRRVLADLRALGLVRRETPHVHEVPFSHRSGARVEPLISLQWFCDMRALAAPAIAAVEEGRVRFHPDRWARVYLAWMSEIRPWCVSRQLWWGHRIPVWYRGDEVHVGERAPEGDGWERDPDVLDTWFSSALWPFATLGWPDDTPELRRFYPTQVLSTARDIIFLWVARMIMMGIEHLGEVPFADVIIHSVIQAPDGRRMSKSLGTGIDPLDLIGTHGADATRFGLLLMSSQQDVRFSEERIRQGRQLVTKLWNATTLVVQRGGSLEDARVQPPAVLADDGPQDPDRRNPRPAAPGPRGGVDPTPESLADRWMASRASAAIVEADRLRDVYDFSRLADLVYRVIFDDYCDWYLEALKEGLADAAVATRILEQLLALAHPLVPFVSEACWERIPGAAGLMLTHPVPVAAWPRDADATARVERVREVVRAVRGLRSDLGAGPREPLRTCLADLALDVESRALAAALGRIEWVSGPPEGAAIVPLAAGRLLAARTAGAVDVDAERARLGEAVARARAELARAEGMLANERFVGRAPDALVAAEREKAARFTGEIEALEAELAALPR